ncbi:MAG: hypothetical protein E7Z95_04625 [Actinomyces succiniciruminis]|nr:hypothetical protein [Actinomyces succiniciruminis]
MATTGYRNRSIKRLHLDLRNPRLGRPAVDTEAEAMGRLLEEFGPKIIGLARSIAEHGLNPTESWAVVREEGKFVVLEGNRRLVACRLLDSPGKAPDPETTATFERIKRGVRAADSYLRPSCVEFEHRSDARYWIHLKHHGAGSGEGTAAWGPEMVYLDQVNSGSNPVEWNEFWYWLEETYQHDRPLVDLIDRARREQYTLMERVYTWKVKELLGAGFAQPGKINVNVDPEKIKPFISTVITGMLTPQPKDMNESNVANVLVISSRTLNSRDSAEDKIEEVWRDTIGNTDVTPAAPSSTDPTISIPTQDTRVFESTLASSNVPSSAGAESAGGSTSDATTTQKNQGSGTTSRVRQPKPSKSETHLYYGVRRSNMPKRVKDILKECANTEIKTNPETASIMARVAVELATDALIDRRNLNPKGNTLFNKLAAALRHLDPRLDSKIPARPELAGTWAAIRTNTADGHFIRDLHNCVHSWQYTAAPEMADRANTLFTPLLNAINTELGIAPAGAAATSNQSGQA